MKKIFAFSVVFLALVGCKMDFVMSDAMSSDLLKSTPEAAQYTTDGMYTLLKDRLSYKDDGGDDGNYYVRHYFQMAELRGDNVTVSGVTEDPFIFPYQYSDVPTEKNIYYTWWIAYKIINAANSNIASIVPGASALSDHLLGENYFFRALMHFHMVTLFAKPYICGRDNPGVIIRRSLDYSTTERATVGQVYDVVVEDLLEAQKYLVNGEKERIKAFGTATQYKGYISLTAAKALLARVYLYMGEDQRCLDLCNELLLNAPAEATAGYDFADYPTHTYNHPETIWCIHHDSSDEIASGHTEAAIGSMYYKDASVTSWGEHYASDILVDNFERYPNDLRYKAYIRMNDLKNDGLKTISIPFKPDEGSSFCASSIIRNCAVKGDGSLDFKYPLNNKNYTAVPKTVNTYTEYYVDGIDFVTGQEGAGKSSRVFVRPNIGLNGTRTGRNYIIYYNTKFVFQDGNPMLSSPVILRWGEVLLNRAEAKAKTNDPEGALADVNIIRHRAGLTAAGDDMTTANYQARGYETVLDVVLDERRRELCFEGHRAFDLFRNGKSMDRRFVGYHPWEVIDYTDNRIALLIPLDEINATGIAQNPR